MKILLFFLALFCTLSACNKQGNQLENTSEKSVSEKSEQSVSEKPEQSVSEKVDFSGTWQIINKDDIGEFTLFIRQNNDSIRGAYCAVLQGGNRMDCGAETDESFRGVISDQSALLEFESSSWGGSGKATITFNSQKNLEWKIISSEGEFLAPVSAVLEKEIKVQSDEPVLQNEPLIVTLKNIEDYFRYIPKEYLFPNLDIKDRETIINRHYQPSLNRDGSDPTWMISISVSDIKNGYMKIETSGGGDAYSNYEIAIFKKTDKRYIVGISEERCGLVECSIYKINFLKYEDNQWSNVTSEVLPAINILDYCSKNMSAEIKDYVKNYIVVKYILPQFGTNISAQLVENFDPMIDPSIADKTLASLEKNRLTLSWKNDKFFVSKVEFIKEK